MKVRALKDGYFNYYRTKGEVFVVPEKTILVDGRGQPGWMEEVPEETPTTSKYGTTEVLRVECSNCGLVVKAKFCGECGTPAEVSISEQDSDEKRADTIQAITGKRPEQKKKPGRPRKDAEEKPGEEI